jgi:DNA-binding NarL/FixJ family response regulator
MARNGTVCLAALTKVRPRLVVLDDEGADVGGPAFVDTLHQHVPQALVVYLATHHSADLERTVRQRGVLYYTAKPLDPTTLISILGTVFPAHEGEKSVARVGS